MRVCVTGSDGFIGRRLVYKLAADNEVLVIDRQRGDDVTDDDTLLAIHAFKPNVVYHLAAEHVIPWCEANPEQTLVNNVDGTTLVADAADTPELRSFVFASSAAVYPYSPEPHVETDPMEPHTVYGVSKQEAEEDLLQGWDQTTLRMRLFNVVGPGDPNPHLLPKLVQPGRVQVGNLWPKRSYVHVNDVVSALIWVSDRAEGAFNVTGDEDLSVLELAERAGTDWHFDRELQRDTDGHLIGSSDKLRATGWRSVWGVDDAIEEIRLGHARVG